MHSLWWQTYMKKFRAPRETKFPYCHKFLEHYVVKTILANFFHAFIVVADLYEKISGASRNQISLLP